MYFPNSYFQMGFDNLRISYLFSLDAPPVHRGTISFGIGLIILEFQDSDVFLLHCSTASWTKPPLSRVRVRKGCMCKAMSKAMCKARCMNKAAYCTRQGSGGRPPGDTSPELQAATPRPGSDFWGLRLTQCKHFCTECAACDTTLVSPHWGLG